MKPSPVSLCHVYWCLHYEQLCFPKRNGSRPRYGIVLWGVFSGDVVSRGGFCNQKSQSCSGNQRGEKSCCWPQESAHISRWNMTKAALEFHYGCYSTVFLLKQHAASTFSWMHELGIPFPSESSLILFLMTGADHHHVHFRLSEWLGGARLPLCSKGSHHPVSAAEKRGLASSHHQPLQRHSVRFCLGSQLQLLQRCLPPSHSYMHAHAWAFIRMMLEMFNWPSY